MASAGAPLVAQPAGGLAGPESVGPGVQRLPPVGSRPAPAATAGPSPEIPAVEQGATEGDGPASPEAEQILVEAEPPVRLWEGSFELGLNGTTGNSETLNFRFGLDAKRKTPRHALDVDLDYRKDTDRGRETAERAFLDWRLERLFQQSPWTCFVHGSVDYDEFQAFDLRVALDIGVGYQFIENDASSFSARLGSGFSKEIGGPEDRYVPEAVFGLDFEHRLNRRQKLTASSEYVPDMTRFDECRIRSRAAWEMLVDEEMNLSLKLSVIDRYDSTPCGAKHNDLDYSVVLLWKF